MVTRSVLVHVAYIIHKTVSVCRLINSLKIMIVNSKCSKISKLTALINSADPIRLFINKQPDLGLLCLLSRQAICETNIYLRTEREKC